METTFEAEQSLSDRFKLLGVTSDLQLSVLGGLVDLGTQGQGAGSYLGADLAGSEVARVVFSLDATTQAVSLTMDQLAPAGIQEQAVVGPESPISHVVTSVVYGVKAVVTFEMSVERSQTLEETTSCLRRHVESFSALVKAGGTSSTSAVSASATVSEHAKITAKFSGDILPSRTVTTFEDALAVIKGDFTPDKIRQFARPQKVKLMPKECLAVTPKPVVHHRLNPALQAEIIRFLTEYGTLKADIGTYKATSQKYKLNAVTQTLAILEKAVVDVLSFMVTRLQEMLPELRKRGIQATELQASLSSFNASAYGSQNLRAYLQGVKNQIKFLLDCVVLADQPAEAQFPSADLSELSCGRDPALVLQMNVPATDSYLQELALKKFLAPHTGGIPAGWQDDGAYKASVVQARQALKQTQTRQPTQRYLCIQQVSAESATASVELALIQDCQVIKDLNATPSKAGSTLVMRLPPGSIIAFVGPNAPEGYLPCSGQSVKTSDYPALWAALNPTATTSGTCPPDTFNVPDLRGQFLRGWSANQTSADPDGKTRGILSTQAHAFESHQHEVMNHLGYRTGSFCNWKCSDSGGGDWGQFPPTAKTGGAETRPVNVAVLYCIAF
ncbi:hypothetical protein Pelo_5043 [Pelomyxa schiedti]|nr:hypothetical protein Pelo_5043 [Pelomyxa schiedti]